MSGDIDAYHDPMDMLHDATQYLERVRQTLIAADRFEDILQVRSAGELYRQYAGQRRYGIDIQNIGAEIKLRAWRRTGELLGAMPKNSGQLFRGDMMIPQDDTPTAYAIIVRCEPIDKCATYLSNHAAYLNYPVYLAKGYPIATGVIEGACRHLVKDHMEITGARWGLQGGEAVLKLRALVINGDFDAYWAFHEPQEYDRNHRSKFSEMPIAGPRLPLISGGKG